MRSHAVIIVRIVFQNPTQMFLAQDNDVVQTRAGSIRSAARQSHSAKVKLVQWSCLEYATSRRHPEALTNSVAATKLNPAGAVTPVRK